MEKISIGFDVTMTWKSPQIIAEGYTPLALKLKKRGYSIYMFLNSDENFDYLEKHLADIGFHVTRAKSIESVDLSFLDVIFIFDFLVPEDRKLNISPKTKIVTSYHTSGPVYVEDLDKLKAEAAARDKRLSLGGAREVFYGKQMLDIYLTTDFFLATNHRRALEAIPRSFPGKALPLETSKRSEKNFCAIPAGAFRFETYLAFLEDSTIEPDAIIIFPTTSSHKCGVDFVAAISAILREFPDEKVIFRPTPLDRNHEYFLGLKAHFAGNDRVEYDLGDRINETYARGKLMLTDFSESMSSFSLSTKRPRIRLAKGRMVPDALKFNVSGAAADGFVEEDHGYYVENCPQLIEAIKKAMEGREYWKGKIQKIRGKSYCNVGHMADYLAENFDCILDPTKIHPDWNYYDRTELQKPLDQWSRADFVESTKYYSDNRYNMWGSSTLIEGWKLGALKYPDILELRLCMARYYINHRPKLARNIHGNIFEALLLDRDKTIDYFEHAPAQVKDIAFGFIENIDNCPPVPYYKKLVQVLKHLQGKDGLYVYGGGEHTRIFLDHFGESLRICGIIDRGDIPKSRFAIPTHRASEFDYEKIGSIIISSKAFEEEIYNFLLPKLGKERIHTLYSDY